MDLSKFMQQKGMGPMKGISVVGIDLAKNVFQLHGVDERGRMVVRRQVKRGQLLAVMAQLPSCLVGMEACSSAHYWAREIGKFGHQVRLMAPKFVKAYLKSQKNDGNDAEAICEAVGRPNMRFVGIKSPAQQDLQCVHRVRSRLMRARTALINELRGLLGEYGLVVPRTPHQVKKLVPAFLEEDSPVLSAPIRALFAEILVELRWLEERIGLMDERVEKEAMDNPLCKRLQQVEGVGPLTATALVATVGDPRAFKNGRQFAAWLGLVPRQNSSGSTTRLGRITKQGDGYLRMLLIHGSRNATRYAPGKQDRKSRWVTGKVETRGFNRACVVLANKNARTLWAMMVTGSEYQSAA